MSGKGKLFVAVIIIGCLWFYSSSTNASNSSYDSKLTEQSRPSNGQIFTKSSSSACKLTVNAKGNLDAFVKVKKSTSSKTAVSSFYVRSGQSATANVPAGTYYICVGMGNTWYGSTDAFGASGAYENGDAKTFSSGDHYTLTLTASTDGNYSTKSLSYKDF